MRPLEDFPKPTFLRSQPPPRLCRLCGKAITLQPLTWRNDWLVTVCAMCTLAPLVGL